MEIEACRQAAREFIRCTKLADMLSKDRALDLEYSQVLDLNGLVNRLGLQESSHDQKKLLEKILILEDFLRNGKRLEDQATTQQAAIVELRQFLAEAILPRESFAERSPSATESEGKLTSSDVAQNHILSYRGILCFAHLQTIVPPSRDEELVNIFTCLASYTDPGDLWTCEELYEEASNLIARLMSLLEGGDSATLLAKVLQERIKPAFAKSTHPRLTQQGGKAIESLPIESSTTDDDKHLKPWKYCDIFIATVLRRVLNEIRFVDAKFVETNWPLITPPLLSLIDDPSVKYKAAGCSNLSIFLQALPPTILKRTGLGEVFENAIMPCLMYLPALSDELDSIRLLEQAYPALIRLAYVRFPEAGQRRERARALDKILRYGVLKGYAYAGEHVKVAEILVKQLMELMKGLDVDFVKHLKHVLTILSAIMTEPFGTAYPPLLGVSVKLLQSIIATVWPRVGFYKGEILKALTVCWLRIDNDRGNPIELDEIRQNIKNTIQMLTASINPVADVVEGYRLLAKSEDKLRILLEV